MKRFFTLVIVVSILLTACNSQTQIQTIEVTRIVQVPATQVVTIEITRQVEVTRQIEVTRVVPKEVTRVVLVKPTLTLTPKEISPSAAFSMNYLGAMEQNGIIVELARVIFMHRDALKPDINFYDDSNFDGHEYVGEIIWRITNDSQTSIKWSYDDINVRVNERQIKLYDYLFSSFGESPVDDIFSGSTIIGGVWFGIGNIKPDEIMSVSLLMGEPHQPDNYRDVASNFIITADLSGEHKWYPMPDELK